MSESPAPVKAEVPAAASTTPAATTPVDDSLDRRTLFVRSIPFTSTSEELSDFFSQFCPVKHAVIVTDAEKNSRGFGFVSFAMDEDTVTALKEARKVKFQGRLLRIDVAKRRDRKDNKKAGSEEPEDSKSEIRETKKQSREEIQKRKARLIIRNLPWSVRDPSQLKKLFSKYGAVTDAIIPRQKGGRMSGFGFVTMKKDAAAEKAIKGSQGLKIDGREVAVDYALEKSKWLAYKEENPDEEESEDEEEDDEEIEEDEEETAKLEEEANEQDDEEADVANEDEEDSDIELDSDEEVSEEEKEEKEENNRPKKNRQEQFSIFIRNLPYDTDEDSLKEHFSQFGEVKYALPVIDRETGVAKGTGFVCFKEEGAYLQCLQGAPDSSATSILISDDVSPAYVYEGRILSLTPTVDRDSAAKLTERNSLKRSELLGKAPGEKDKRNLFLLNEGRITEHSKLASKISKTDLELREKSYKLRVQHLNKNPALHLSLTRLAIRNLPRAMNAKALKALGRKAVVQFATEVKDKKRQPLSKEEFSRSQNEKEKWQVGEKESNNSKKQGVVRQAKIIMEVKGTGENGRSRGYGFLEFRDHKSALMGLRWLNAHEVSIPEILEGLTPEEKKRAELEGLNKRKLIAEFAIEHANIVKRRREKIQQARENPVGGDGSAKRPRSERYTETNNKRAKNEKGKAVPVKKGKKGNMNKGAHVGAKKAEKTGEEADSDKKMDDDTKKLIGMKRKRKQQRKGRN
ncbi:hypothetical protein WICPIJ_010049 [Wickerhamomyces pijperi]|uniref:RRM domain-containing protein n=1 Tax=Wickerhamomyces pijperi TaxID=599730 RepID=A0A9P8PHJ0_WICPI|nr:hypothetical protein WICPIJ_010049 [Wickerhamomyces pijperi]